HARRVIVFVFGMTLIVIGIAMLVLPGPATVVIPAGIALLASEFVWARRFWQKIKRHIATLLERSRGEGEGSRASEREGKTECPSNRPPQQGE
ncbi:MAG: hypothetical protein D6812_02330, partial [Deltaproteobacteria bacterium]